MPKNVRWFLLTAAPVWLLWTILLWREGYEGSFLLLNALSAPWLDQLMPHLTHLADGGIAAGLVLLFTCRRDLSLTLLGLLAFIALGLVIVGSKHFLFSDWHRPATIFEEGPPFHFISLGGERLRSFPSGHSAVGMLATALLALRQPGRRGWPGLLLALLGLLLGYTRLYIGVHFLGDVLAGSLIGAGLALLFWRLFHRRWQHWLAQLSARKQFYWQRSLLALGWVLLLSKLADLYFTYYYQ